MYNIIGKALFFFIIASLILSGMALVVSRTEPYTKRLSGRLFCKYTRFLLSASEAALPQVFRYPSPGQMDGISEKQSQ